MAGEERIPIRSYARIWSVDRRIYKIERWRLPVPGGIPLRAVLYFLATLLVMALLGQLPGIGALFGAVSPVYVYVMVPLFVAALSTQVAPDGRAPHRFLRDWLGFGLRARRRSAGRTVPREREPVAGALSLPMRPDHRGPQLRRARVVARGSEPVEVAFREPVLVSGGRRRRLRVRPVAAGGRSRRGRTTDNLELAPGQVMEIEG